MRTRAMFFGRAAELLTGDTRMAIRPHHKRMELVYSADSLRSILGT